MYIYFLISCLTCSISYCSSTNKWMLQGPASKGPPGSTAIILGGWMRKIMEAVFPNPIFLGIDFGFSVVLCDSSQELLNIPSVTLVFAMNQSFIIHNPIIKWISENGVSNSISFWSYKNELISFVCNFMY